VPQREREWPATASSPPGLTLSPDALIRSDRSLIGPLRSGTAAGAVGPRGRAGGGESDYGTDRPELRPVDSIGCKYPETDRRVRRIRQ